MKSRIRNPDSIAGQSVFISALERMDNMRERLIFKVTFTNNYRRMPITYGVPTCDLANMIKWVTRPGTGGNLINIEPTDYDAEQDKDKDLVILPHDTWGYLLNYWHKDLTETDRKELWVSRDALIPVSEALQEKGVKTMIVKQGNRILDGWYKSDSINKDPVSIPDMRDIVE